MLFCYFAQKRFVSLGEYLRRMGRRNRNVNKFAQRKRDRKEQEKNRQENPAPDTRRHYEDIVRENANFEEYYKVQKVCPEDQWEDFMKSIRDNLPTAFRITGSKYEASALLKIVTSEYFSEILNMKLKVEGKDDEEEIKPINLPWYPGGLAWQLRLSRMDIRRNEALYRLHNFLVAETAAGGVSRQETVSMIPPVVLQVQSHHKVLDMCAAPGSKTAQLIEFLHSDEDKTPTGFVIANDVDNSRCYMLVHQAKRLNSPCIVITNHDSAFMPTLLVTDDQNPELTKPLKFDRILCDVPCSGDATLRKNPDIWLKWSTGNGNNLHGVQYRILRRGCELLSIGGRLVYSTCSFNPIENEAVIHRLLQEVGDTVKLVDVTGLLPGLKFHKGMTYWRPASKDMVFYDKYEDVPEKWQTVVRPQMFPPKPEHLDKYHLDRCIRILPHHQDTGGFFVALFEKTAPLPWEKDQSKPETTEPVEAKEKNEPPKKRRRMGGYKEDPFVFFSGDTEDVFPSIKEFYDLKEEFDPTCLLTRCHVGKKKNIYMVSPTVKDIVQKNENNIKIINTGVKTFVRCDNKNMTCPFRLSQEGLQSISRHIGAKRRLNVLKEDLILVLQNDDPSNPPDVKLFSEHTQNLVKDFATGSCVLDYKDTETDLELTLVGWRGVHSLRAYTATNDTVHYLRLLGADYSKYDVNKFKKTPEVTETEAEPAEVNEAQSTSENDLNDAGTREVNEKDKIDCT
ncbi:tRNA (cytosine(34)-C(5))-methyltransferase [Maniola hyperantus]|uniref:tRNA (cytosine(34)-C(5))-methyltransferase n=1 Tax=Aphantopus hyperantus TaxID=2795564 RepID=UPI001569597E|nr:tRNA (cytosine(34)-C(5))-methyltransferase [Maniola hyperantus]